MTRGRGWGRVIVAMVVSACAPLGGPGASPTPNPGAEGLGLELLADANPEIAEESIVAAFGAEEIRRLLGAVPPGVDPEAEAVFCVALGMRPTGGYGLVIQSASLVDRELRIRALETQPRPGQPVIQVITYPVGCFAVRRAALPTGELMVRADDPRADEFITSAVIEVPAAERAP
jgi:hypothetical protein